MTQINNLNMQTIYSNQRKKTDLIYKKDPKNPNLQFLNCAILILNLNIGLELFYLYKIFQNSFILALVFSILAYLISLSSFILLSKCWIYGQSFSYMTIWENTIGTSFSWVPNLLIVLSYFNLTINLYGEMASLLQDIFIYINVKYNNSIPSIISDQFFILYIFIAIPSILISFAKEIHCFVIISWIKFLCFIVVFAIHLYKFIIIVREPTFSVSNNIQISINGDFYRFCSNFVYTISIACFQPIIEHIVQVMKKPTLGRTVNIYFISTLSGFFIMMIFTIIATLLAGKNYGSISFYTFYEFDSKITICSKAFAFIFY